MAKKKSRRKRKKTGKVLRLIAGIMGAISFGMAVYKYILSIVLRQVFEKIFMPISISLFWMVHR